MASLRTWLFGRKLDPFDPRTRQHLALAAFLAWVGLGADGLSSSCYGPEEAFLALGAQPQLALYLAIATAVTVFVIALAYNQVIELFPSGGGGYKAATALLGPYAGLISGSALIVDYILTIAISVASGMDALFSLISPAWQPLKLDAALLGCALLLFLNLRGMKESILFLMPIFLGFFLSHVALIVTGIRMHGTDLAQLWNETAVHTSTLADQSGWFFVMALLLRAFSVGGGTYTGIEAVSNSVNLLAEPRVRTGHFAMAYMAVSLAFTAGGIILLYLLWHAAPAEGRTLNAVVFGSVLQGLGWAPGTAHTALVTVLALEAGLLFVAANTGFIGGPAVLASMAADRWVPRQFRQLSSRLVTRNGLLVMGVAALLTLGATRGSVALLVVLYSINVFLTFSLSLLGLCRHWWEQRQYQLHWKRQFLLSAAGFSVTAFILVVLIVEKFTAGGWVTMLLTGAVASLCLAVRWHYDELARRMAVIDERFDRPAQWERKPAEPVAGEPAAVLLVGGSRGAGMYMLEWVLAKFGDRFRNYVFVSVGEVDRDSFSTSRKLNSLKARIDNSMQLYLSHCAQRGLAAKAVTAYGGDPLEELMAVTQKVLDEFPGSVCFATTLVFPRGHDTVLTRLLHNQLPLAMQRKLHRRGQELIVVPLQLDLSEPPPPPRETVSRSR